MTPDTLNIRLELYPFLGQKVTATATLSRKRRAFYPRRRLLKDVQIGEEVHLEHLWIVPSPYLLTQVGVGERFTFDALVMEYPRRDGTVDAGLVLVSVRKGERKQ